jgi:hypothetical protein
LGRLFRRYGFATILAIVACGSWKSSVNVDAGACRSRIVPNGLRGAGKSTSGSLIIIFDLYGPNGIAAWRARPSNLF